jgi:hypothetical protein
MCADVRVTRGRDGFLPPHGQKHDGRRVRCAGRLSPSKRGHLAVQIFIDNSPHL